MGVRNERREWVERINNLTIEVFSIKFAYSQPQTAYDDFTSAITNSRRKMSSKRAALDGLKTWKENKSRATLFWLGWKQALAIKNGKSMVGTSLVDSAENELLISIRDEASCVSLQKKRAWSFPTSLNYLLCILFVLLEQLAWSARRRWHVELVSMDLIIKVYRKAKRCSNATDIKQEGGWNYHGHRGSSGSKVRECPQRWRNGSDVRVGCIQKGKKEMRTVESQHYDSL